MAEVQRVLATLSSAATLPGATIQNSPETSRSDAPPDGSIGVQEPGNPSNLGHIRVLAVATLGATLGFLTGTGFMGQVHAGLGLFAVRVLIAGLGAYFFFDPAIELLHRWLWGEKEPQRPHVDLAKGRKIFAISAIAVATILISAFHESLGASVGKELSELTTDLAKAGVTLDISVVNGLEKLANGLKSVGGGLVFALVVFAFVAPITWGVTHFWVRGAKQQPPRAALYGSIASLTLGLAMVCLAVTLLLYLYLTPSHLPNSRFWGIVAGSVALFWFFGSGLLGGLAIDKRLGRFLGRFSPPVRALFALAGFSLVFVLLLLLKTHASKIEAFAWLLAAQLIFQNLGWGFGLYLQRESSDLHLAPAGILGVKSQEGRKFAPVATFPSSRGGLFVPAASPEVDQTSVARPQDLVLKPQGDRLWAAMALLLALITGAIGFYVGSFRTDPEIAVNIQQIFLQDSGLRRTGLSVHSSDRIVTISGVVEDEMEHAAAVQRALSVRGVKQLIDQIKVAPDTPPTPKQAPPTSTTTVDPAPQASAPLINATISIGGSTGPGKGASAASPKLPASQRPAAIAKPGSSPNPAETPKTAEAPKHKGLLNFLKKDKNIQGALADAKKPPDTPKTTDAEKRKGLFHFLKKDKDKNKENKNVTPVPNNKSVIPVPNNKNNKSNKNPKKEVTKNPAVH